MIANFPFEVSASVVPLGKRKHVAVRMRSQTYVEVREASGDEAPLVAWFGPTHDYHVALRSFEGRLYEPVVQDRDHVTGTTRPELGRYERPSETGGALRKGADLAGEVALVSAAGVEAFLARGARGFEWGSDACDQGLPLLADYQAKEIVSPEAALAASIQQAMGDLLLIDGVCYRRTECPCYQVDMELNRISVTRMRAGTFGPLAGCYRVDRYEDAVEAWREILVRQKRWTDSAERQWRSDRSGMYELPPVPEVVRPDLLPDNEREYIVKGVANRVVSHLRQTGGGWHRGPRLAQYPRDVILAYGALRDALATGEIEGMLDAIADMVPTMRSHGTLSLQQREMEFLLERLQHEDLAAELAL